MRRVLLLLLALLPAVPLSGQGVVPEELFAASPDVLFTRIGDIVQLSSGRIIAVDPSESRLTFFDGDGSYLARVGREGTGPGEYRSIGGIWVMAGDSVGVWDSRNGRVTILDGWGETGRTFSPDFGAATEGVHPDRLLAGFADGHFVLASMGPGPEGAEGIRADRVVLELFGPDGEFVRALGEDFGFLRVFSEAGGGPLPFSPYPWGAALEDDLLFTNGYFADVRRFDRAGSETSIPVKGESIELADAWDRLDEVAGDLGERGYRYLRADDRRKGSVPALGRIFVSDEGHLWVKAYAPTRDALPMRRSGVPPGGSWTVYTPGGEFVASVEMPDDFAPMVVAGDRIVGVTWSPFDEQSVAVFRWSGVR